MDIVHIGLIFTYILLTVGVLAAIIMPLFQAITTDPKSLLKSAMGLGVIVVIYFIGYALAGDEVTAKYSEFGVDASISKMVGGILNTMYILMFGALAGILFTEVHKVTR
ncbi:MAG: hypothetical protein IIB82_02725 [Bacteroidetes bacterium]|nr:hypothetical protein [Bacteroidota bacterium]